MAAEALFHCPSPLRETDLYFRSIKMREELGQLPEYHVELVREAAPTKPVLMAARLLGKATSVQIKLSNETFRYVHGVITHFERGGSLGNFDTYRVILRPWLWQLTLGADCRVFQDKTVLDILRAVFDEYHATCDTSKLSPANFRKRPYTVQYNESDYNFVARLMEEEGIYYYFTHTRDKHTMILCNSPGAHQAFSGGSLSWYAGQAGSGTRTDTILEWARSHSLQSLKYAHTDFAAEATTMDLLASAARRPPASYGELGDLEVFRYPGGHDDLAMTEGTGKQGMGETLAQHQVDRFESEHSVATGLTQHRALAVGTTFQFKAHPDEDHYLVTGAITRMEFAGYEASFTARGPSYVCRFNAVPKKVPYKPPATAQRAIVHGPQTATVVGPSGDELHTDKFGRVKVLFHWDRFARKEKLLEKSSCWVRVAHPWAGKGFGMVALPRVGDELVVEFMDGNPDRPLITGRVYNGTNMPPYELPAHASISGVRTRSTKDGDASSFNELRFEDKKGEEYVWLQAQKDFHRQVKNDAYDTVGNDAWCAVTKNADTRVGENLTLSVGKVSTVKLGEDVHAALGADLNLKIGGALNLAIADGVAVKGDQAIKLSAGQALDIDAGQTVKLSATSSIHIKGLGVVIDGGTQLSIKAGAAFITLGPDGVSISGPMVKINSGGSAGAASNAAKASPASPKAPQEPKANEDPLTKKN